MLDDYVCSVIKFMKRRREERGFGCGSVSVVVLSVYFASLFSFSFLFHASLPCICMR